MSYIRTSGRCIRCRKPFPPDASAIIAREKIAGGFLAGDDGEARDTVYCLYSDYEWVAVCENCATPKEAAAAKFQRNCEGCGLPMLTPRYPMKIQRWLHNHPHIRSAVCSVRCEQRYRRKLKRQERAKAICSCCRSEFVPTRSDAQFCSNACRQWAYRLRRHR
jgi:hypothetical protein